MGRLNPQRVIPLVIREELSQVRTSIPARVESYDPAKQTAKVQILLKTPVINGETGERSFVLPSPIPDVPVVWPSGAGRSFILGLEAGDPVTLMVCDSSTDEWSSSSSNNPQEPFDTRKFDLSDAFAIPGGRAPARALGSEHFNQAAAVIKTDELRVGDSTAAKALALAEAIQTRLDNIIQMFNVHSHVSGPPGSPTGPPVVPMTALTPDEFASGIAFTSDSVASPGFPPIPDPPPTPEPEPPEE